MKAGVRTYFIIAILLIVAGCRSEAPSWESDPRPVLTVGDHTVSVSWFEQSYIDFLIQTGQNDTERHRYLHLENLIDALLLSDEARSRGLALDSSFIAFSERERKKALGGQFFLEEFLKTLPQIDDAEVRQAFTRWKEEMIVRHLFYRREAEAVAAYQRLLDGRDFLEEAQDCFGLVEFDSTAGYLGPVRYFNVDDAFAEAAFSLDVGSFSPPVRSRFGYHIILAENRIISPLLTESEYQTRRKGMESKLRLRKRRLEGDHFVMEFMTGLEVQVEADAIQALGLILKDIPTSTRVQPTVVEQPELRSNIEEMRRSFDPSTLLATYTQNGRVETFTLSNYLSWLEDLPWEEARDRTAASVGRALRNEVFARSALDLDLDNAAVKAQTFRAETLRLASQMRKVLKTEPFSPNSDDFIMDAVERIAVGRQPLVRVDYWTVRFDSRERAQRALERIQNAPELSSTYSGFDRFEDVLLPGSGDTDHAAYRALVGEPVIVGLPDGWAILMVEKRSQEPSDLAEQIDDLREKLLPLANEYELVRELRERTPISVDSTLFKRIMDLSE